MRQLFNSTASILDELNKVPLGRPLVALAKQDQLRIHYAPSLNARGMYNAWAKTILYSTASPITLAHELRHHDQIIRGRKVGFEPNQLSATERIQYTHLKEADANAYSFMVCKQLCDYYSQNGDERRLSAYNKEMAAMIARADVTCSDEPHVNSYGLYIFNQYNNAANKRGWYANRTWYEKHALGRYIAVNKGLNRASLYVLLGSGISVATASQGFYVATAFSAAVAMMPIPPIKRSLAKIHEISRQPDPERLTRLMEAYGAMPDGTNYLHPLSASSLAQLKPDTLNTLENVKTKTTKRPLYKFWKSVLALS